MHIIDDHHKDKICTLAQALRDVAKCIGELADRVDAIRGHAIMARETVGDCIDEARDASVGDEGPTGDAFRNYAAHLFEAEIDLTRLVMEIQD